MNVIEQKLTWSPATEIFKAKEFKLQDILHRLHSIACVGEDWVDEERGCLHKTDMHNEVM